MRTSLIKLIVASTLAFGAIGSASAATLITTEKTVATEAPGIGVYVRNKHPEGMTAFTPERTLLFVHGATYPASTAFDLQLDGKSWMDYIAERGYDVWLLDLRNYGRSSREAAMEQPADANGPLTKGSVAVADIGRVVDMIRAERHVDRVSLLGWSWGTTLMATYTSQNVDKVARLVLYAPQWVRVPADTAPKPKIAAYRVVDRASARDRWLNKVPADLKDGLIPAGWFDAWADATFATDPKGEGKTLRAPNGIIDDKADSWTVGKPYYDPAKITVPTMLVVGKLDVDCPPAMAEGLFPQIGAQTKRLVELEEGTHTIIMERNRMTLFNAVQQFLDDPANIAK